MKASVTINRENDLLKGAVVVGLDDVVVVTLSRKEMGIDEEEGRRVAEAPRHYTMPRRRPPRRTKVEASLVPMPSPRRCTSSSPPSSTCPRDRAPLLRRKSEVEEPPQADAEPPEYAESSRIAEK
jgi:hypothetical protein